MHFRDVTIVDGSFEQFPAKKTRMTARRWMVEHTLSFRSLEYQGMQQR